MIQSGAQKKSKFISRPYCKYRGPNVEYMAEGQGNNTTGAREIEKWWSVPMPEARQ